MSGFRRAFRGGIVLQIQQTAVIDFTLELGAVSEEVEVKAEAPVLESTTTTLGKVVDNRRIGDLPLNTRNVYSLIFLTPGVTGSIGNNYNSLSYSVNGARPTMMDTVIDGVTASFPTVNGFTGIDARSKRKTKKNESSTRTKSEAPCAVWSGLSEFRVNHQ